MRASIYTVNTGSQAVATGGTLALGSIIHRFGNECGTPIINLNGNGITTAGRGYYDVTASVVASPLTAGTVTVTLYRDGVAVPGATASGSVTTAGNPVNLSIVGQVRNQCCDGSTLTLVLTGNASTVNSVAVRVGKV